MRKAGEKQTDTAGRIGLMRGGATVLDWLFDWFRDSLLLWIFAGIAGAIVAGVAVVLITASNAGSRNIVVATGAVAGALLLYIVQVPLELRRSIEADLISLEYTIDRAVPSIRQYRDYGSGGATTPPSSAFMVDVRVPFEIAASQWLAGHNPGAFTANPNRVLTDFVIFNLLGFLLSNEYDWQIKKRVYRGAGALYFTTQPISPPNQCTTLTHIDLRARMTGAGNLFADAPFTMGAAQLCLPPRSTLQIADRSLVLRNPVCELSFTVDLTNQTTDSRMPKTQETPQLDGASRFETHLFGFEVTTTYFALRAQDPNIATYRAWRTRIVDGAQAWFEP